MRLASILLASLALCLQVQARIGETPQQCIERYGEPETVDKDTKTLGFIKDDIAVMCTFHEGLCTFIAYKKTEDFAKFSDAEFEALMDANGSGWKPYTAAPLTVDAKIGKGTGPEDLVAFVPVIGREMVTIATKSQLERNAAEKAAGEKEKLKGF